VLPPLPRVPGTSPLVAAASRPAWLIV